MNFKTSLDTWMYKTSSPHQPVEELLIRLLYYQKRAITFTASEWKAELASFGFDLLWTEESVKHLACNSVKTTPLLKAVFETVSESVRRQPYAWSSDDTRFLRIPQRQILFRVLSISDI